MQALGVEVGEIDDPLAYLKDLLTRLPRMTNQDDLRPLLPRNWLPPQSPQPQ